MRSNEKIKEALSNQLFASIPVPYATSFKAFIFSLNMPRFAVQSLVLVFMDLLSLFTYLYFYSIQGIYFPLNIWVHVIKILLMGIGFFYFSYKCNCLYNPHSFLDRNWDIIYPAWHFVGEFLLFATGSLGFGAMIRFLAVPFIVGGIPLLKQTRVCLLSCLVFIVYTIYLPTTPYAAFLTIPGMIMNLWIVVFSCVNLVSFTVYSGYVNNYIYRMKEEGARKELSRLNQRLDIISKRDQLTRLSNRRGLQLYMEDTWRTALNQPGQDITLTVMMLDIDYFKRYNDRFGHLMGDECLVQIANAINKEVIGTDFLLARYGGEEFIIIAYQQKHQSMVELANRIRKNIEALKIENPDSDISPYITICIGVASQYVKNLDHYNTLIEWADECLYFAKQIGRNQIIHTKFERGRFRDITGNKATAVMASLPVSYYDEDYIETMLQEISADCTFVYDTRQNRLQFSKTAVELFEMPSNIIHPTIEKVCEYANIVADDQKRFVQTVHTALQERVPSVSLQVRLRLRDQSLIAISIRAQFMYGQHEELDVIYGSIYSIHKMLEYNHYLQQQSMLSSITQLPNRQRLHADLKTLLAQEDQHGYLLFLDVINFKEINGSYSHNVGDRVLREAAAYLSKLAADYAPVYNYAIDQFIIIVRGASPQLARKIMDDIQHFFASHTLFLEGLNLQIQFTMTAVAYNSAQTNLDGLLVDLDMAMQLVKYQQNSSGTFFTEQDRAEFLANFNLNNALRKAVENHFTGFMLYYQPIIRTSDQVCIGAEALLRWRNAAGEIISPLTVIPVLEKFGLMASVEEWIFDTACRQCSDWIAAGAAANFFMHINLSPAQITRPSLYDEIFSSIERHGLQLDNILLEVTESTTMQEVKNAVQILKGLRDRGLRIAIDDFGTGYSSLSYLNSLPADEIKIDRSFVNNITDNEAARDFLASIIGLTKSMGFTVCVEGVETAAQFETICGSKSDYVQGFLFSKPVVADEFFHQFIEETGPSGGANGAK